jgi:hypothetical protein
MKNNALIISNNNWKDDFRLHQIKNTLSPYYNVHLLTSDKNTISNSKNLLVNLFKLNAIFKGSSKLIFSAGALTKSLIFHLLVRDKLIVFYVRELITLKKSSSLKIKAYIKIEKFLCKRAAIVVTGNSYRADYLKEKYDLTEKPLVWDNMRKLNELLLTSEKVVDFNIKYNYLNGKKIILFTSGYSIWRETDKLILSKKYLNDDFLYLIVGGGMMSDDEDQDYKLIQKIIIDNDLNDVYFQDKVGEEELLYLIRKAYIGVVHYNKIDFNNLYCASGKLFEFINEEVPIVTTSNPPLVDFTTSTGTGLSVNELHVGINEINNNYKKFKSNIIEYLKDDPLKKNNLDFIRKINSVFSEKDI